MKVNTARLFNIEMPSESPPGEDAPPPVRAAAPEELAPRVRKTTFDVFNEEMAVLERPLEGEVEYFDEPKPRRWKVPAIGLAIFVVSCAGGYLALSHGRASGASPAIATASSAPAVATAIAPAATSPPMAAPVAPADPSADEPHHRARHAGGEQHHHHASRTARHGHG